MPNPVLEPSAFPWRNKTAQVTREKTHPAPSTSHEIGEGLYSLLPLNLVANPKIFPRRAAGSRPQFGQLFGMWKIKLSVTFRVFFFLVSYFSKTSSITVSLHIECVYTVDTVHQWKPIFVWLGVRTNLSSNIKLEQFLSPPSYNKSSYVRQSSAVAWRFYC